MNKIILHIPHSSERLPKVFWENICITKKDVQFFVNAITDTDTLKLYGRNHYKKIHPKYSRVFCDVEKFEDDKKEIMSKFGMGVVYTKTNTNLTFFKPTKQYINFVLSKVYRPYHKMLDNIVEKSLNKQSVIIVDCHSFSKEIIMFEDRKSNLPDICLGYNKNESKTLIKFCKNYFTQKGYLVKENYPYSGSIIPNKFTNNKPDNLHSIMIEINKALYLKSELEFKKAQKDINELFKSLNNLCI